MTQMTQMTQIYTKKNFGVNLRDLREKIGRINQMSSYGRTCFSSGCMQYRASSI